jgi:serine protease AprX
MLFSEVPRKYWVYFKDKGPDAPSSGILSKISPNYKKALDYIHPRALSRRAKVLSSESLLDAEDLPLYKPYINRIEKMGGILQQQSRWINAASFNLTDTQIKLMLGFSFVKKITPVVISHSVNKEFSNVQTTTAAKSGLLDYGNSATQVQMINAHKVHQMGITGKGVLLGMLDSGFRWRDHEALQTRKVIAEYDFIQRDTITSDQPGDVANQEDHGTRTMSTLGGYKPGKLIGPAFDVSFILGKTESLLGGNVLDYHWEEDNWAAGIEWMENYGVDAVNSSVGYNTFVDDVNYTWANGDFDGQTSVTAKAASRAAQLGVVVCTTMGNEGNGDGAVGRMVTPADADIIISVGAVTFSRRLASFSSTGPTNDGRIKPDVVAPGSLVYAASPPGPDTYSNNQGTSFSTPLTAGVAALVLSARPELTPIQVRDAIRNTADTIDSYRFTNRPNNFTGWGLVNAFNAVLSFGTIFSNSPVVTVIDTLSSVAINVFSKYGINPNKVVLHYAVGDEKSFSPLAMTLDSSMFFATSGRYKATIPVQARGTIVSFYIDAQDSSNISYQSPAEVVHTLWQLKYGIPDIGSIPEIPTSFALYQNYPNPFNPSTVITYKLPVDQHVSIKIYNALGEEVQVLVNEFQNAGYKSVRFFGENLPSGVYFYRLVTPTFIDTKKMLIIR